MIYTLIGSVLMLLGILMLYWQHYSQFQTYSFEVADLMRLSLPWGVQWWVFWAFFLGFAVKVPMWPFHTWLPDAHVEAPTAGSVILASVLLKMGTYGFLRFSLPLLPETAKNPWVVNVMALLSIIGIIYGALASLMQKDWKKLVAYSSVSHLGFCTLGIFALNPELNWSNVPRYGIDLFIAKWDAEIAQQQQVYRSISIPLQHGADVTRTPPQARKSRKAARRAARQR
jgi:NADH-quinone oxidoreductase subunit M